jgi:hypothetical protein
MNQATRKRLEAAIRRLTLQSTRVAREARTRCCFCACQIQPGDSYQASGQLEAHHLCITATAQTLREKERTPDREKSNRTTPTPQQLEALTLFAAANGRNWKSALRTLWENGAYERAVLGGADSAALQQIRNTFGPTWLTRFSLSGFRVRQEEEAK